MALVNYIEELYRELDISSPIVKEQQTGAYTITFEEELKIAIQEYIIDPKQPYTTGIAFTATLGTYNENTHSSLLQDCMVANLFGCMTQKAILGLSGDGKTLTLCREIPYTIGYTAFRDELEAFLNIVDFWIEKVTQQEEASA